MKTLTFQVYGFWWAGNQKITIEQLLSKYVAAFDPTKVIKPGEKYAPHYVVDITPEELLTLASSNDFDLMISQGSDGCRFLAFDEPCRHFRQR